MARPFSRKSVLVAHAERIFGHDSSLKREHAKIINPKEAELASKRRKPLAKSYGGWGSMSSGIFGRHAEEPKEDEQKEMTEYERRMERIKQAYRKKDGNATQRKDGL